MLNKLTCQHSPRLGERTPNRSFGEQDGFDEDLSDICGSIAAGSKFGDGLRRRDSRSEGDRWRRWRWWWTYPGQVPAVHSCRREIQLHGSGERIGNFVFYEPERHQLEFDDPDRKGRSRGRHQLPLAPIFELHYRDSEERVGGDTADQRRSSPVARQGNSERGELLDHLLLCQG